ncbi:MAG: hypothetical protein ACRD15_03435 [Vicinamibacterales bacterium]
MDAPKPSLPLLYPGNCEPLKAACHGLALVLAGLMGAYNTAAWLRRRQSHLAINAAIYMAAAFWEQRHVAHHLLSCLPSTPPATLDAATSLDDDEPTSARAA